MSDGYRHGEHVWRENWSDDVAANKDWYSALLGWGQTSSDMGDFTYWMFTVADKPLGGFSTLRDEQKKMGIPAHWLTYISVADVDATAAKATAHGGRVLAEPFDIPEEGRVAVIMDPQGAVFAIFKATDGDAESAPQQPPLGEHWWAELLTSDVDGARAFYTEVFGWTVEEMSMGETPYIVFLKAPEAPSCGCLPLPDGVEAPPHWLLYFAVQDCDATVAKAKATGGVAFMPPMETPGVGRFAALGDPQGAGFGVIAPDVKSKG